MRIVFRAMFAMLAIANLALGADNALGTWKFNAAKSAQARGASLITELTTTWESAGDGVKIAAKGARADGSKIDAVIIAKYDGREVAVTGTGLPYDTVALTQVNPNKVTAERTKKRTKYHGTVQIVISADGKTMTQTTTGIGADDKTLAATAVYDKQ